jgi:hypothetical protein
MYSPKIDSGLIPLLYRVARCRKVHMTTLVNEAIAAYLAQQPNADAIPPDQSRPRAPSCGGSGSVGTPADEPQGKAARPIGAAPRA